MRDGRGGVVVGDGAEALGVGDRDVDRVREVHGVGLVDLVERVAERRRPRPSWWTGPGEKVTVPLAAA